jgi:subtilisin family serine protease
MKKNMVIAAVAAAVISVTSVLPASAMVATSWGLDRIDGALDGSYNPPTLTGAGVTAYVLDSGVNISDSGFGGRASGDVDCMGHGTHVAGIIGSSEFGVARGVKLVSIKVTDNCGGGVTAKNLVAGIDKVLSMHQAGTPGVVNISITIGKDKLVDSAIGRLYDAGLLPVVAASNVGADACLYSPSGASRAFTVGGINKNDYRTNTSSWGNCVDIFAPGGLIVSENLNDPNGSRTMTGTSMATPHVTGVAALYLEKNPKAKPAEVEGALRSGALSGVVVDAKSANGNYLLSTAFLSGQVVTNAPIVVAPPTAVEVPTKVSGISATRATNGYIVSWKASTNVLNAGAVTYKVEASTNKTSWAVVAQVAEPSVTVPTWKYYRVTAVGTLGASAPSLILMVVTK